MATNRRRNTRRSKHKLIRFFRSFIITLLVIGVCAGIAFAVLKLVHPKRDGGQDTAQAQEETVEKTTVEGMDINALSKGEIKDKLMEKHPWSLSAEGEDGARIDFDNEYESLADEILTEAYSGRSGDYSVEFDEKRAQQTAESFAALAADALTPAVSQNEAMVYNPDTDSFDFHDAKSVRILDTDSLISDIKEALTDGDYTGSIEAKYTAGEAGFKAEDFKLIGSYTTNTTNNSDRNTNVRLSCEAVNGKILQPGERFSYNETLGKRTAEKGYKEAGAYANGEHVTELGGGVCQLSSTLYNATIAANLQVDERTGHTYEPSYVTPGEDATVSYSKPDYAFTNNTQGPVGILAHYADRVVTVKIYGLPQLEEGVSRHLRSEKIAEVDPPLPNYVEDPTVVPGYEDIVKKAKYGSKWKTFIVLEKDGEVISEEYLHTTTYKGEPATIRRNLNGLAALGFGVDANGNIVPVVPQAVPQAIPEEMAPEQGN